MGLIRGGLLVIVCVLTFFILLAGNVMWTMSSSLQYNNLKPQVLAASDTLLQGSDLQSHLGGAVSEMQTFCQTATEYNFNYQGGTIKIPCSVISQGTDAIINYGIENIFSEIYYQEYNCDFWSCFQNGQAPFFLISQKAHNYWHSKFLLSLLVSLGLAGLIFLLSSKRRNFPVTLGIIIVLAAIPILWLSKIATSVINLTGNVSSYVSGIITIFFNQSAKVFWIMIGIGAGLVILGFAFKFIHAGTKLMEFFSKFRKTKPSEKPMKQSVKPENQSKENKK